MDFEIDLSDLGLPKAKVKELKAKAQARPDRTAIFQAWRPSSRPIWKAEAVVLILTALRCDCGETFGLIPAASGPLVRFRSLREPNSFHEIVDHVAAQNPDLPREIRHFSHKVSFCQHCWNRVVNPNQIQLDLLGADLIVPLEFPLFEEIPLD